MVVFEFGVDLAQPFVEGREDVVGHEKVAVSDCFGADVAFGRVFQVSEGAIMGDFLVFGEGL